MGPNGPQFIFYVKNRAHWGPTKIIVGPIGAQKFYIGSHWGPPKSIVGPIGAQKIYIGAHWGSKKLNWAPFINNNFALGPIGSMKEIVLRSFLYFVLLVNLDRRVKFKFDW
jgi:hypothetical protein